MLYGKAFLFMDFFPAVIQSFQPQLLLPIFISQLFISPSITVTPALLSTDFSLPLIAQ